MKAAASPTLPRAPHLVLWETGEDVAEQFLVARGWEIVARRDRMESGCELDLVAVKSDVLAFVEVKTRGTADAFDPTVAMNPGKMRKFVTAARTWLVRHADEVDAAGVFPRLDVVTVVFDAFGGTAIEHFEDAFEAGGG